MAVPMKKEWGIDLEGRRMRWEPWPHDGDGVFRSPRTADEENMYAIAGSAATETAGALAAAGHDVKLLVDLLNHHFIDSRFSISVEDLRDPRRAYSHECYFYIIMFAKRVAGDYGFRYLPPSGQCDVHHKIYEQGFLRFKPWGVDEGGKQVADVTSNLLGVMFATIDAVVESGSDEFVVFMSSILPNTIDVPTGFFSHEGNWISYEYIEYGFEFIKILLNKKSSLDIEYGLSLYNDTRMSKILLSIPLSLGLKYTKRAFSMVNRMYEFVVVKKHTSLKLCFRETPSFDKRQRGLYIASCMGNDMLTNFGGLRGTLSLMLPYTINSSIIKCETEDYCFILEYRLRMIPRYKALFLGVLAGLVCAITILFIPSLIAAQFFVVLCSIAAALAISSYHWMESKLVETNDSAVSQLETLQETSKLLMLERDSLETKVRERTKELADANEKLKELDAAKTAFFVNVSHELRTPLTLIKAPLEGLRAGLYGDCVRADDPLFATMERQTTKLLGHINDLLSFTRITMDATRPEKEMIDVAAFCRFFVAEAESLAASRRVSLSFSADGKPLICFVDPALFETAFLNLLSNALKFTPPGGAVAVSVANAVETVTVAVRDTGVGIEEDQLELIFNRFYQADTSSSRKYEGLGIGLSLARDIARLHGGDIQVKSRLGQGSEFRLLLPLAKADTADFAATPSLHFDHFIADPGQLSQPALAATLTGDKADGHDTAVLVVEDNIDMRSYLRRVFSERYAVVVAEDGLAALELLKGLPKLRLIVSDIMMPRLDGLEFFKRVRQRPQLVDVPFIFLTARADEAERLACLEGGAVDYITKPFSQNELLAKAKNLVDLAAKSYQSAVDDLSHLARDKRLRTEGEADVPGDTRVPLAELVSPRELEVLHLVAEGLTDKEIGVKLGLSARTVSNHLRSISDKTQMSGRQRLATLYRGAASLTSQN